jgi:hypothetical protein
MIEQQDCPICGITDGDCQCPDDERSEALWPSLPAASEGECDVCGIIHDPEPHPKERENAGERALRARNFDFSGDRQPTPAPSDQEKLEGWQPIETAPKDETQILVEVRAGYFAVVSYWGAGWRESANGLLLRDLPLRWMAIPRARQTTPAVSGEG